MAGHESTGARVTKTIRIESEGDGKRTKVTDAETGKDIEGACHCVITLPALGMNKAVLTIASPVVYVSAESEIVYKIPDDLLDATFVVAGKRYLLGEVPA